jgi:hypothetical protein
VLRGGVKFFARIQCRIDLGGAEREVAKIELGAERVPNTSGPEHHCERKKQLRKRPRRGATGSGGIFKLCCAAILKIPRKFVLGGPRSLEYSKVVAE